MTPIANVTPACPCDAADCPGDGGGYYVSLKRDRRVGLLLGPFETHTEALARVREAFSKACDVDPWAAFDAVGTVRMRDAYDRPGVLNGLLSGSEGSE